MAASLTISVLTDVSKAVGGLDKVDGKAKSLGSTLGAAGASIAGAFSTEKIVSMAQGWLEAGMGAAGAAKNVKVAFGESASEVLAWGETASATFGTTAADADAMAAKLGVALTGYGISAKDAAHMSEELVHRSADIAKVMGTDTETVLAKVTSAMRGRTAGLKDYGVQVDKGASSTEIFNAIMSQTSETAGRSDTTMGEFHATMGDLTATLGTALLPVLQAVMPIFQGLADWAKNNHAAFVAIVLVFTAIALVIGIATTAAGIFALVSWSVLWPVLAVVGAILALGAAVLLIIKYWDTLVGWFHTAVSAIDGVIDKLGPLVLLFGPLGAAILVVEHFGTAWNAVVTAVNAVYSAIDKVIGLASKVGNVIGGALSHIPGVGKSGGGGSMAPAAGPSLYGVAPAAVTFAPTISISGDVGDPVLAGRRIVAALEAWSATNGRRRIAALVGP